MKLSMTRGHRNAWVSLRTFQEEVHYGMPKLSHHQRLRGRVLHELRYSPPGAGWPQA